MRVPARCLIVLLLNIPPISAGAQAALSTDPVLAGYEAVIAEAGRARELERLERLYSLWEQRTADGLDRADTVAEGALAKWVTNAPEVVEVRRRRAEAELAAIRSIDPSELGAEDRLEYELFLYQAENAVASSRFPWEMMPIYYRRGVHREAEQIGQLPTGSPSDYEEILAWLNGVSLRIDEEIQWMKRALAAGVLPPRVLLRDEAGVINQHLAVQPLESPYLQAFTRFPDVIKPSERARLTAEAVRTYERRIVPAYRRLHRFFTFEYLPRAREDVGWSSLPGGPQLYEERLRFISSSDLTPEEAHQVGVAEVQRIRGEIEVVRRDVGFEGSLQEFVRFLSTDPQFTIADSAALITAMRDAVKRVEPELFRLFYRLPRLLPAGLAGSRGGGMTTVAGSWVDRRPSMIRVSPAVLGSTRSWQILSMAMWAGYPGHHIADAWAAERAMVPAPAFLTGSWFGSADHGWAAYATTLADEMGVVHNPYERLGALALALRHSILLAVETGIHHRAWTRDEALEFARANALPEQDFEDAVNQMIAFPGASHYRLGALSFARMRQRAEAELGAAFDLRAFHDAVMEAGMLPLPMLDAALERWITAQKSASKG